MAFSHGKDTVFKIDNSGGSLQDISTYLLSVGFPQEIDMAETSTFGTGAKTYVAGMTDATISIEGRYDPTVDNILNALKGLAATQTFEYGPQGGTGGAVKYTGECRMTSYEVSGDVGDMTGFSAEFQVSGSITRTTF